VKRFLPLIVVLLWSLGWFFIGRASALFQRHCPLCEALERESKWETPK
jgi:hypothetical protein